jgi:acyl carrier protein
MAESASAETQKAEGAIQDWLLAYLSELLEIDSEQIEINDSFASYGLDSSAAVGMVGDLSEWLNRNLDAELIYRHPTIASLSRYLASGADR